MNARRLALRTTVALLLPVLAAVVVSAQPAAAAVVTTSHTGSGAPALAQVGDRLYVAWTGTQKDMIVGYSTAMGKNIVKLSSAERSPQNEGPALVADPDSSGIFVAWADTRTGNTLTMTYYSGTAFSCRTSFTGITTPHAPALAVDLSGKTYVAWTDANKHLNIALIVPDSCATTHVMTMVNRMVLSQTSPYGPGLVFETNNVGLNMVIAWVADNSAHSVNVASWVGSTTLANVTTATTTAYATSGPSLSSAPSDLYIAFRGSNNHEYFGYSEGCVPTCFNPTDIGTVVSSAIGQLASGYVVSYFDGAGKLTVSSLF